MEFTNYTPKPVEEKQIPVSYALKADVTGKAPPNREPIILSDKLGHKLKVPFPPKPGCKKCFGRGYVGITPKNGQLVACRKCYRFNTK